ncbi:hypothetical protein [Streptomyces sp. NRRL B-1347]|uniref:hypothetical protein n=1 Tax=Streptomyces sp. NRRL B-1347 TaxID=1476877 RepID=UPI00068A2A1B|nr:hypothetical protein [Streptomyces sp. NRRL B-1347]
MDRRRFVGGALGVAAGAAGAALLPAPTAGAAARADGWQQVPVPDGVEMAGLRAVAAAGPRLAWAVGTEGRGGSTSGKPLSYVWNGTVWSRTDTAGLHPDGSLMGVAANASGDAWAIGVDHGTDLWRLYAWDGDGWERVPFPGEGAVGNSVHGITVAPDGDAWAVGSFDGSARTLHWNGRRWRRLRPLPSGNNNPAVGVRRTRGGDIWIHGSGVCARWDGAWHEIPVEGHPQYVTGMLPTASDDIWVCGYNWVLTGGRPPGARLRHYDGTAWHHVETPFGAGELVGIVGDARDRPDRIAGWEYPNWNQAHHLRWENGTWVSERGPVSTSPVLMNGIARVPGTRTYWAVGSTSFFPRPPGQVRIERLSLPGPARPSA